MKADYRDGFRVVEPDEEVEQIYGYREYAITVADIAALLSGKALYATVKDAMDFEEYAFEIILERGNGCQSN